jgi:predicted nucleic acid-binding protein
MREVGRIVVSNTTPLIALTLIGQLDLLRQIYGEVNIPPAVRDELVAGRAGTVAVNLDRLPWIRVVALQDPRRVAYLVGLDRGEAEVIVLAEELSTDVVLIDERLGRRYARHLGLPFDRGHRLGL